MLTNPTNSQELKTNHVKQVWGGGGAAATPEPAKKEITSHYNQGNIAKSTAYTPSSYKKKEVPKPIDEKKEKMKNDFFGGIGTTAKDSDDSDEETKPKAIEPAPAEPAGEMNLLDMDTGPAATTAPASGGNLLDDMFADPAP